MHPILFEVPGIGFEIPSFGVLVATGFLVGVWLWGRLLARYGSDPENDPLRAGDVSVWLLIGVIGGARLMYVGVESARYLAADTGPTAARYFDAADRGREGFTIQNELVALERDAADDAARAAVAAQRADLALARRVAVGHDFLHSPQKILFVWEGGLVMYGGFFGAILLGCWAGRKRGLHVWNGLDTALVAGMVGLAIGRWGCLLVGDDFGSVVPAEHRDLPFPLTLRVPSGEWLAAHPKSLFPTDLAGEVLWATQPWMSINALLVALVAWSVLKRRRFYGQVTGVVLIHYALTRGFIEAFRGDEIRGLWFGGTVSTSQLIGLLGLALGVGILVANRGKKIEAAA